MKTRNSFFILFALLLISACTSLSQTAAPAADDPTESAEPVGEAATEEPEPTAKAIPTQTPLPEPVVIAAMPALVTNYGCDGELTDYLVWCLLYRDGVTSIPLTDLPEGSRPFPETYDYAALSNLVLVGLSEWFSVSPGGFSATDLWLGSELPSLELKTLIEDAVVVDARFTPTGRQVVYLAGTDQGLELRYLDLETGADDFVAANVAPDFSISQDGSMIGFVRNSEWTEVGDDFGLYIVDLDSGDETLVPIDMQNVEDFTSPAYWSTDGQTIVVRVRIISDEVNTWKYMVYDLATGSSSEIAVDSAAAGLYAAEMVDLGMVLPMAWAENGQYFLGQVETGLMTASYTVWILKYNLDPVHGNVVSIDIVAENAVFVGWDVPGESVWVNPIDREAVQFPYRVEIP